MMRGKMTPKKWEGTKADKTADKKAGVKEGSPRDMKMDRAGMAKANKGRK